MPERELNKTTIALGVIDLQKGIAAQPAQPYPAQDIVRNAAQLVTAFRKYGMPVFLVYVVHSPGTMLNTKSETSFSRPTPCPRPGQSFSRRSPRSHQIS
jgi:nicotinamidase-related amidase